MKNNIIKRLVFITCFAFAIILTIMSFFVSNLKPMQLVSSISTTIDILIFIYYRFAWRWPLFKKIFKYKDLNGKWECTIIYDKGENYEGGKKDALCIIKQDLLDIKIFLKTNENTSKSIASIIDKDEFEYTLLYMYKSETNRDFKKNNPDKYGAAKLNIVDENHLNGEYWTNGKSAGKLILEKRIK